MSDKQQEFEGVLAEISGLSAPRANHRCSYSYVLFSCTACAAARLILEARRERDKLLAERGYWQDMSRTVRNLIAEAKRLVAERDALKRELERWKAGTQVETDYLTERDMEHLKVINERDALANLVGQAICMFTLRNSEALSEPKDHALIAGISTLVEARDAALARVKELEAERQGLYPKEALRAAIRGDK